jgi:hypothetical protein
MPRVVVVIDETAERKTVSRAERTHCPNNLPNNLPIIYYLLPSCSWRSRDAAETEPRTNTSGGPTGLPPWAPTF